MNSRRMTFAMLCLILFVSTLFAQGGDAAVGQEMAKLKKLETTYAAGKAAFTKAPKDAKKKRAYVDSTVEYGHAVMVSPALPPRAKYPKALKLFREALKVEPKNAKAKKWSTTIEEIYKSMGRPVPKV